MRLSTTIGAYQPDAVIQGCEVPADAAMVHLTVSRNVEDTYVLRIVTLIIESSSPHILKRINRNQGDSSKPDQDRLRVVYFQSVQIPIFFNFFYMITDDCVEALFVQNGKYEQGVTSFMRWWRHYNI